MSLKVLALGTGVCATVPLAKKPARQPPGFLVIVEEFHLLLDCSEGISYRLQTAGIDLANVAHVAVTHAHPDHAALPQFIQTKFCQQLWNPKRTNSDALTIYLPRQLARDFPQVWNWHQPENDGSYWHEFTPKIVGMEPGFQQKLAPGVILHAADVYHGYGRHPAMGFRIETPFGIVVYTGDTGTCDGVSTLARNADLLIADCQTRVGQEYTGGYGHMGPRQCGDLALKAGVKTLWLTHYFDIDSSTVALAEVRKAGFFGETRLARDGEQWVCEGSR